MRYILVLLFLLFSSNAYSAQQGSTTGVGTWDMTSAKFKLPNTTTCVAGDCDAAGEAGRICIDTDATSGQQVYVCEGLAGWKLQGDGGAGGAPTDADYLVGTANGSLSAEIVVGTSPGGELGGTWASPTIDDSVAVTSWNLTTPTITTSLTTSTPTTISAAELDRLDGLSGTIVTTAAGTATLATTVTTNANLTGEVTSVGNAATIADTVTVTGWTMGASVATTPSADDNDTSLATTAYVQTELNAAGGRSLSCSSGSCDADVELYTRTICYRLKGPLATDDDKSIWINDSANQFTVTKLWCESDQTVNTMFQVDDGTPADMDTVDLACITTPDTDTSLDGDATIAAGDRVDLDIASVSGSPTWVTVCFTGTYDD